MSPGEFDRPRSALTPDSGTRVSLLSGASSQQIQQKHHQQQQQQQPPPTHPKPFLTDPAKTKKNTLNLLKQVEFVNQTVADEALGIYRNAQRDLLDDDDARNYTPPTGNGAATPRKRFLSDMSEYDDWSQDPFYDVSPYTSDDDKEQDGEGNFTQDKKRFSAEDRKFFRELDRENEREAKRIKKSAKMKVINDREAKFKEESDAHEAKFKPSLAEQRIIERLYEAKKKVRLLKGSGVRTQQKRGERLELAIHDFTKQQRKREKEFLRTQKEIKVMGPELAEQVQQAEFRQVSLGEAQHTRPRFFLPFI